MEKKRETMEDVRVLTISEIEEAVKKTVGQENFQELCSWAFEMAYQGAPYQNIPRAGKQFTDFAKKERDTMLLEVYQDIQASGFPEGHKIMKPDTLEIKRLLKEEYVRKANPLSKAYRDTT